MCERKSSRSSHFIHSDTRSLLECVSVCVCCCCCVKDAALLRNKKKKKKLPNFQIRGSTSTSLTQTGPRSGAGLCSRCCSTVSTWSRLWPPWPPAWCQWRCCSPSPSSCGSSAGRPRGIKTASCPCPKDPWDSPSSARPATGSCR